MAKKLLKPKTRRPPPRPKPAKRAAAITKVSAPEIEPETADLFEPAPPAPAPPPAPFPKAGRQRIGQTLRLDPEVWLKLKTLAAELSVERGQQVSVHELVVEGVGIVLARSSDRKKPARDGDPPR